MGKSMRSDNKIIQFIAVLALVVTLTAFGVLWTGRLLDARKFADIGKDKDAVVNDLVKYLGDQVASSETRNFCFNTNQGPYDNGRLWCQVATVVRLSADVDQKSVGQKFIEIAMGENFSTEVVNGVNDSSYWFQSERGVSCRYVAIATNGQEVGSATAKPFNTADAPAVAIACADTAKAKHYTYVDR